MPILATSVEPRGRPALEALPGARVTDAPLTPHTPGLPEAEALCVAVHDQVAAAVLDAAPRLRLVVTRSTGINNVDVDACAARGVVATPLPEYATDPVAEMAVAGMVLLLRHGAAGHRRALGGAWAREGLVGRRLRDCTVGVVGVGRIGKAVAARCLAHGARVAGHDIVEMPDYRPQGFRWAESLEALLPEADVLTLHVPLTEATRGLIGADELALLPEGALLVNTARGGVVDTAAMAEALESGRLSGAYLDVMDGEPAPPLLARVLDAHPNVLVTPHLAAYDAGTIRLRYELAAELLRELLAGDG